MLNFNSTSSLNGFDSNYFLNKSDQSNTSQQQEFVTESFSWTTEQDDKLLEEVKNNGKHWSLCRVEGKNGKQCRERYLNHLQPGLIKGPFSEHEKKNLKDILLQQRFNRNQKRFWPKITEMFNEKVYGIKDQKPRSYLAIRNCYNGNWRTWKNLLELPPNEKNTATLNTTKRKSPRDDNDDVALKTKSVKVRKKHSKAKVDDLVKTSIPKLLLEIPEPQISDSDSDSHFFQNTINFHIRKSVSDFQQETSEPDKISIFDFLREPDPFILEEILEPTHSDESLDTDSFPDYLKETSDGYLEV